MKVAESDREVVVSEALALAEELPPGEARDAYRELAWAAEQGEIPGDLAERLGQVAAVAVETGRARAVHGPGAVRALTALWRDTPQGRRVSDEVEELNTALTGLRGQPVEAVRVAALRPGAFALTVAAGPYEIRIEVDRAAASLRSVNVGGGGVGE